MIPKERLFLDATWHFGELPDWFQVIPGPGTWKHPEYGDINITKKDLAEFADNFKKGVYQEHIAIDAEHDSKLSGACGYYTDIKVGGPKGESGLWAQAEWNDRGSTLLKEERYKYFSPEWYDKWTDPATDKEYHNVLVGGALTTRPFFKDSSLHPLVATEGYMWRVCDEEGTEHWEEIERQASQPDPERQASDKSKGGKMSDLMLRLTEDQAASIAEGTTFEFNADQLATVKESVGSHKAAELPPEAAKRFADLEAKAKAFEEQANKAAEKVRDMERQGKRKEFSEFVRENRPAFQGEVDEVVARLEKFSEALSAEDFDSYKAEKVETAKRLRESGLFDQKGKEGVAPNSGDQFMALVKEQEAKGLNTIDAMKKVASDNPALYNGYDKEQKRVARMGGER